jgi:cell division protein FtsN
MANYPDRKKAVPARRTPPQSKTNVVGLIALGFVVGYVFSWFYSPMLITNWLQTHFNKTPAVEDSGVELAALPKPKFEFYTLLSQEKVQPPKITPPPVVSTPHTVVAPTVATTVEINKHKKHYVLQLASFQRREDAEQMLAGLVIRGFEASIKTTTQQGSAWHRVVMGPFVSRLQAEKAQGTIAQSEHISGIIRRMES